MAWEFTVTVFCVTAFFVGLFAAVYVAFAASARFNAQRLLVAAEMAFRPAALSFRLGFGFSVDSPACFLDSAHLFRCASAIAFLPAALIFRRLRFVGPGVVAGSAGPPESMARSSLIMGPWIEMAIAERDAKFPQCPWLFFNEEGKQIGSFRKAWTSACKRAGVAGLLFHDLRRSAVVNMDRAGVLRRVIMQITGHKTEVMFTRYRIVAAADLKQAARRMEAYLAKSGGAPLGATDTEQQVPHQKPDTRLMN